MGLGQSKDLDLLMCYKGKWQRNHGLSWSKDLDFNRYTKKISRKTMGLGQSKDLRAFDKVKIWICLCLYRKRPEKSWVWAKVKIWTSK